MIYVICMKPSSIFENKDEVRITQPGYLRLQFSPVPFEERTFNVSYEI